MNATLFFSNLKYDIRKPYVRLRNRLLAKRYPWLLPYEEWGGKPYNKTGKKYDYSYLMAEPDIMGWNKIIFFPMMEEIRKAAKKTGIINNLHTSDYKSKYGGLRFYLNGYNDEISNIVRKYETLTQNICEICGEPDVGYTRGWITPICRTCYKRNKWNTKPYDEAISEDNRMPNYYEYIKFDNDKKVHYKIDIKSTANKLRRIWNFKHPFRRKKYA